MQAKTLSIFDYIDYRLYLTAYYTMCKENQRRFSHRSMASCLGFTSPNFLKLVMDGERNISKESLDKIIAGLDLNKQEAEYFSYLVFFAQAKNNIDKNYYFGLIAAMRGKKNTASIAPDQFEYFGEWYNPSVRELVCGMTEPLDYEKMSAQMHDAVSAAKIKKAVELLVRLGLIKINENNSYMASSPLLNTANELNSFSIRRYHAEVLEVAQRSLETISQDKREFSHVTVKISPDIFAKIKTRIQEFREEILQMVETDTNTSEIYHANFQLYPVTKSSEHDSNS